MPGLNTAALPDLIFTVLFFFMIVTHMRSVPMKVIQLNDKLATIDDVEAYVKAERQRMQPEDMRRQTVSIKADRTTDMQVITDVKQALRRANAYTINYSATEMKHEE